MQQVFKGGVPSSAKNSSSKRKRSEFSYEIDGDPEKYEEEVEVDKLQELEDNILISQPLKHNDFYAQYEKQRRGQGGPV